VEKGLKHLDSIGADVAGFVFNRARARDFARSAHASSLRSISSDAVPVREFTSEAYSRFGPLVQCVVSLLPVARDAEGGARAAPADAAPAGAPTTATRGTGVARAPSEADEHEMVGAGA
jgi:hypothetical protein